MEMTGMKKRDVVTPICWVILGFIISIWSATFPFGSLESPGPAFFPLAAGLILIFLGSILFFQARARKQDEGKPMESFVPLIPRGAAFKRVAWSLGGMFLSAVLLEFLGFVLTFFCLIIFLIRAIQPEKWRADILYTLAFTLGAYLLFQVLLKTTLPTGILGF
jgi:putative tricarboxylic transport membrane protein